MATTENAHVYPSVGDTCVCEKCKAKWQLTLADVYGARDYFTARFAVRCPKCFGYDIRRIERA